MNSLFFLSFGMCYMHHVLVLLGDRVVKLVCTGFVSQYRLKPRANFIGSVNECKTITPNSLYWERERERERQTDRQRQRQKHGERNIARETDRQTDTHTHTHTHTHTPGIHHKTPETIMLFHTAISSQITASTVWGRRSKFSRLTASLRWGYWGRCIFQWYSDLL